MTSKNFVIKIQKRLCEEPAGDEAILWHYVTKGQIAAAAAAASQ